jgi:hypothetical protein
VEFERADQRRVQGRRRKDRENVLEENARLGEVRVLLQSSADLVAKLLELLGVFVGERHCGGGGWAAGLFSGGDVDEGMFVFVLVMVGYST